MREEKIFCCELCDYKSMDAEEVTAHEAAHFGMTPELAREYRGLCFAIRMASTAVSACKNQATEAAFDRAIENQLAFEKEHQMTEAAIEHYRFHN